MLLFDIGANRGDATVSGLSKGYTVVACEPAPRIYSELVKRFIYNKDVVPLKVAVSDTDNMRVDFYEAQEDGLSTLNKDWLTDESMPYAGKPFRTVSATTVTLDTLSNFYGVPDLIKIDVEGAEWLVFKGLTTKSGVITFEWTEETLHEHQNQLEYLTELGYTEAGPQFIEHHLQEPQEWFNLKEFDMKDWVSHNAKSWVSEGWLGANLRPTADVGMLWVR